MDKKRKLYQMIATYFTQSITTSMLLLQKNLLGKQSSLDSKLPIPPPLAVQWKFPTSPSPHKQPRQKIMLGHEID